MKILDPRFNIEISLRDPDFIIMIFASSAGVLDIFTIFVFLDLV